MAEARGVEFYLRFLNEKSESFRTKLMAFIAVLPGQDAREKLNVAKDLRAAFVTLRDGLAEKDRPHWMHVFERPLHTYVERQDKPNVGPELLKALIQVHADIQAQRWEFVETRNVEPLDLDAIFRRYHEESRVPELFNELISQLTTIVEGGAVDRLSVIHELKRVIVTLSRSARGTHSSVNVAWQFTSRLFENFLWEALSDVPVLGASVRALRTTFDELDAEMTTLDADIRKEVALQATPEALALPASKDARLLTSGEPRVETDAELNESD